VFEDEGELIIYTQFEDFGKMQKALEERQLNVISSELQRFPLSLTEVTPEQEEELNKLIEKFEEDDDVNAVYHNMDTGSCLALSRGSVFYQAGDVHRVGPVFISRQQGLLLHTERAALAYPFHQVFVFLPEYRTGDVNQRTSRLQIRKRILNQGFLQAAEGCNAVFPKGGHHFG